jgi:hypothetical protein
MKLSLAVALLSVAPVVASAQSGRPEIEGPSSLVSVSVDVDGRTANLYPAPDGSGRQYLEARPGASYAVRMRNRTGERVAVQLTVDGLNAISGERQAAGPGRMYILDPWQGSTIRGWRTSMEEIRQFTFVDEKASYAARSGKANGKMGWIEIAVYRERRPAPVWRPWSENKRDSDSARGDAEAGAPREEGARDKAAQAPAPAGRAQSYPGTGWGDRSTDHAVVVEFQPQANPAEQITLRYEYRSALQALGILPRPCCDRDRLSQREQGTDGFAQPPTW